MGSADPNESCHGISRCSTIHFEGRISFAYLVFTFSLKDHLLMLPAKEFLFSTPIEFWFFFHLDKILTAGVEGQLTYLGVQYCLAVQEKGKLLVQSNWGCFEKSCPQLSEYSVQLP